MMLYFALVRWKLEYGSAAWNSVTITDSNKLERTQRKFAAIFHSRFFFQDMQNHYNNLLERSNLLTFHNRHHQFEASFLINIYSGTK
jgi:hypothetical protein